MSSGFNVVRSAPGLPYTVSYTHAGIFLHDGVDIGDVFYKDGDVEVSTYSLSQVKKLLKTATPERQATFSFLAPMEYTRLVAQRAPPSQPPRVAAPQAAAPCVGAGFTVIRSQAPGRPYTVRTITTNVFAHAHVDVGHVFYKDGDVDVVTYNNSAINELLKTATPARQAAFSFLSLAQLSSCNFTAKRAPRGGPYVVASIHPTHFRHTGNIL
jgi:hypothetical protein